MGALAADAPAGVVAVVETQQFFETRFYNHRCSLCCRLCGGIPSWCACACRPDHSSFMQSSCSLTACWCWPSRGVLASSANNTSQLGRHAPRIIHCVLLLLLCVCVCVLAASHLTLSGGVSLSYARETLGFDLPAVGSAISTKLFNTMKIGRWVHSVRVSQFQQNT